MAHRRVVTGALLLVLTGKLFGAAFAATTTTLLQEQIMSFYGSLEYTKIPLGGDSYEFNHASGDGRAYNYDGSYSYSGPMFDDLCYYGSGRTGDGIGPFTAEQLFSQMKALAPAAANLLDHLCAANSTCAAALAAQLPAGETAKQSIRSWTAEQALGWHTGVQASSDYDPDAQLCPGALSYGIFNMLSDPPQTDSGMYGMRDWSTRPSTDAGAVCATSNGLAVAFNRLFGLQSYVLPPWLALAERLIRDLVLHNAPEKLYDPNPYNIILNPDLAQQSYGASSGFNRRLLAQQAIATSSRAAPVHDMQMSRHLEAAATKASTPAFSTLDARLAEEMADLQPRKPARKATTSTQRVTTIADCSARISAYATVRKAAQTQCKAAMAAIGKMTAALERVATPSAGCSGPARLGLSVLTDALAVCPEGSCTTRNTTRAVVALAKTCASMAPAVTGGSDLSWTEMLSKSCDLAGVSAKGLADAATCCGSDCTRNSGCDYATIGFLLAGFPNLALNGSAGSSIC